MTSELHLPAQPPDLGTARDFVERAAADFGFDPDQIFDFNLAANEAVTNAIRHGSPDEHGRILLRTSTEGDRFTLMVRDYGEFAAPRGPQRLDGGRGIAMMDTLTDFFELRTDALGTTVRLSKDRV